MKADARFQRLGKNFWAHVKSISEAQGYTIRGTQSIKILNAEGIIAAFAKLQLTPTHLVSGYSLTNYGVLLCDYFAMRAYVLENYVQHWLMDAAQAKSLYLETYAKLNPTLPPVMNKQKGEMANPAYLTGLVNMIVESVVGPAGFNPNPGALTTFTQSWMPLRTLSRRVDGAIPGVVNPVAIWEIKEYYYTTTFGSRVADGVYETLLDGLELEEMREHTGIHCSHMLAIDAYQTWWGRGRSYLCRMIDMLHMGAVDDILFGREVVHVLPDLVAEWRETALQRAAIEPQSHGPEVNRPGFELNPRSWTL